MKPLKKVTFLLEFSAFVVKIILLHQVMGKYTACVCNDQTNVV